MLKEFLAYLKSTAPAGFLRPYWRALRKSRTDRKRLQDERREFWAPSEEDEAFVRVYAEFLRSGDTVFDVGANLGVRSREFHRLGCRVIAFEPQRECQEYLRRVFREEGRFVLVPAALGPEKGSAEMMVSRSSVLSTLSKGFIDATTQTGRFGEDAHWDGRETVEITTLDDMIARFGTPRFIKIDVEGFEREVLQGLSSQVPALSIEFTAEYITGTYEALNHLRSLGEYEGQVMFNDSMDWKLPKWLPHEDLVEALADITAQHRLSVGDVYVRFADRAEPPA